MAFIINGNGIEVKISSRMSVILGYKIAHFEFLILRDSTTSTSTSRLQSIQFTFKSRL